MNRTHADHHAAHGSLETEPTGLGCTRSSRPCGQVHGTRAPPGTRSPPSPLSFRGNVFLALASAGRFCLRPWRPRFGEVPLHWGENPLKKETQVLVPPEGEVSMLW